jgi:indole-3-glycerol phosphate synthase
MILDEILANKRREVAERKQARPQASLIPAGRPRDFAAALRSPGLSIIAEIKRRSPSGGELRPGASAADLARTYAAAGAAALSVLTDYHYFGGEDHDLVEARAACRLPVLRKDFLLDDYQVHESRALGADAVLLIVRALTPLDLAHLIALAEKDLGMAAVVETHSGDEVRIALETGAQIVGVNNRDLDTLKTHPGLALSLRDLVPPEKIFVAESGVSQPDQLDALAAAGAHAVLIGETLLRADDPGARLRDLALAAQGSLSPQGNLARPGSLTRQGISSTPLAPPGGRGGQGGVGR